MRHAGLSCSSEDFQVSGNVADKKAEQNQASHCRNELFADRAGIQCRNAVHESVFRIKKTQEILLLEASNAKSVKPFAAETCWQ